MTRQELMEFVEEYDGQINTHACKQDIISKALNSSSEPERIGFHNTYADSIAEKQLETQNFGKREESNITCSGFNHRKTDIENHAHLGIFAPLRNKIKSQVNYGQLADFIYRPSHLQSNDTEDILQLEKDLTNLSMALDDDPETVLDIIAGHQYTPAIYYLSDLAKKIKDSNQVDAVNNLYKKCSDQLIHVCIFTVNDLKLCIEALPLYQDEILNQVIENDDIMKRIFNAYSNESSQNVLDCLTKQYPEYSNQFINSYNKNCLGFSSAEIRIRA